MLYSVQSPKSPKFQVPDLHLVLLTPLLRLDFRCAINVWLGFGLRSSFHFRNSFDLRPSLDHIRCSLRRVLLEVLVEEDAKLRYLCLEALASLRPGVLGVQQFRRDAAAGLWYCKVECVIRLVFDLRQLSRVDGVKNGTSVFQSVMC